MRIIPLAAVGLALAIGSMAALASAQPAGTVHHVGVLGPAEAPTMVAFRQALKDRGYSEERNIRFTYHEYRGPRDTDRVAEYWRSVVNDLLRLKVDVIVTTGPYTTRAAKAATETVPIVFNAPYVVDTGVVSSLPRPGANLTGVSVVGDGFTLKQLELLKEMVPRAKRMAILSSWDSATKEKDFRDSQAAADRLGIKLRFLEARAADDIDRLIKAATEKNTRVDAIHVYGYSWLYLHRKRIMAQAKTRRLPMMYFYPGIVEEGGLMAFGPDMNDQYRQMARLVDRILKGARPSDLPVEEPAKYILAINLRTARELGLTVPQSLLQRADRVIE